MNTLKIGKCHFIGEYDLETLQFQLLAKFLEDGNKMPFPGLVVVRSDGGENIYIIEEEFFSVAIQALQNHRQTLANSKMVMPITAIHRNVIERQKTADQIYWTFGNIFGRDAILVEENQLQGNNLPNAGQKLKDVVLLVKADACVLESWKERCD